LIILSRYICLLLTIGDGALDQSGMMLAFARD